MSVNNKLFNKILSGSSDKNINFNKLCTLIKKLGFNLRIKGSHHIFYKEHLSEIINIQPEGSKAKPYQIKQIRNIIIKYQIKNGN